MYVNEAEELAEGCDQLRSIFAEQITVAELAVLLSDAGKGPKINEPHTYLVGMLARAVSDRFLKRQSRGRAVGIPGSTRAFKRSGA
jgi:hypothetical protein